jgi:hypothetical protein
MPFYCCMTMKQAEPHHDAHPASRRIKVRRLIVFLLVGVAIVFLIVWYLMLPAGPQSVPGTITAQDKKQVAQLCRRHTVRFGLEKLRRGEAGWFVKSTRVLFQQKINRFSDNGDGTYAIHTVVFDAKGPDGFYDWWRHQVTKTNGQWTILRSY